MTHYAENRRQTFKMKLIFVYMIEFRIKFVSLIYHIRTIKTLFLILCMLIKLKGKKIQSDERNCKVFFLKN